MELKKSDAIIQSKDARISKLELKLQTLRSTRDAKESELKKQLDEEKVWADSAMKESEEVKTELVRVKEQLSEQDEAMIIAKFKAFPEYDQAIANAGASEVLRCWFVAKKHIKTDLAACWDSFVEEFLTAKHNFETGIGEPVPYDGPNPTFLPGPPAN